MINSKNLGDNNINDLLSSQSKKTFKEKIEIKDWLMYKENYSICQKRPKFGKKIFPFIEKILKSKGDCQYFIETSNCINLKSWSGKYKCKICHCEYKLKLDETELIEKEYFELNIIIGNSKCITNKEDRQQQKDAPIDKVELYCKKNNKYIDVKSLVTMITTDAAQVLSRSLISDGEKIKGFVHQTSIFPYGYLLQSEIQVIFFYNIKLVKNNAHLRPDLKHSRFQFFIQDARFFKTKDDFSFYFFILVQYGTRFLNVTETAFNLLRMIISFCINGKLRLFSLNDINRT